MKKIFCAMILLIYAAFNLSAEAKAVQVYDGNIEDFFKMLNHNNGIMEFWGKKYFTEDGYRYCMFHYSKNKGDFILCQVNNNGAISGISIVSVLANDSVKPGYTARDIILLCLGMTVDEWENFTQTVKSDIAKDKMSFINKIYRVHCSQINRTLKIEYDLPNNGTLRLDIDAYI